MAVATVARADSRAEAKRYFKKGMAAIAAGDLEKGIAALERAYDVRPHPAVLYNIARAYSDMGDTVRAIEYFDRYLASEPATPSAYAKWWRRCAPGWRRRRRPDHRCVLLPRPDR